MKVVAFERTTQGTSASRRLRHTGKVPGIIYGAGVAPRNIELDHNALFHAMKKEQFHSSVLDMEVGTDKFQALLRDVQLHAYKPQVLHVDFQRVDPNVKLFMKMPLHFAGGENSPAVKLDKSIINTVVTSIEITCLPKDLPEFIAVDLSSLAKGQSITSANLQLPAGVSIVLHGKPDFSIATVVAQGEEEVAPAAVAAAPAPAAKAPAARKEEKKGDKR
jgi:large subunit ribosomal protein L25